MKALSFIAAFLFLTQLQAQENKPFEEIPKKIERLIKKSRISRDEMGVYITAEIKNEQRVLVQINEEKKMTPASLSKVITAAAVLEKLPASHQFVTQLLTDGAIQDGVLNGDLILKGGGDTGFVSESMWFLVNELRRSDIKKITGNIIVDDSRFDSERFDKEREDSRVDRAYDAPVGAMSFNWNSVNVYVRPGKKVGDPVQVFSDPANAYIRTSSKAKTVSGSTANINVSREKNPNPVKGAIDFIYVSGELGINKKEVVIYKGITDPVLWSGYNLADFLNQRSIDFQGTVKSGTAKESSLVLAESKSRPLPQLVADMMKFSNNYVAEMLVKNLAYETFQTQGTMEKGMVVIRDYLESIGIKKTDFEIVNPSGLTRKNKFKPKDLHKILHHVQDKFTIYPEYLNALPIAGVDGTIKNRMPQAKGWVRAKTGLLTGVVGLAGYAGRRDGLPIIFVLVYNGSSNKMEEARNLFDQIAQTLIL